MITEKLRSNEHVDDLITPIRIALLRWTVMKAIQVGHPNRADSNDTMPAGSTAMAKDLSEQTARRVPSRQARFNRM